MATVSVRPISMQVSVGPELARGTAPGPASFSSSPALSAKKNANKEMFMS